MRFEMDALSHTSLYAVCLDEWLAKEPLDASAGNPQPPLMQSSQLAQYVGAGDGQLPDWIGEAANAHAKRMKDQMEQGTGL